MKGGQETCGGGLLQNWKEPDRMTLSLSGIYCSRLVGLLFNVSREAALQRGRSEAVSVDVVDRADIYTLDT